MKALRYTKEGVLILGTWVKGWGKPISVRCENAVRIVVDTNVIRDEQDRPWRYRLRGRRVSRSPGHFRSREKKAGLVLDFAPLTTNPTISPACPDCLEFIEGSLVEGRRPPPRVVLNKAFRYSPTTLFNEDAGRHPPTTLHR